MKDIFDAIFDFLARKISYTFGGAFFSMIWSIFISIYGLYFFYSTSKFDDLHVSFLIKTFIFASLFAYLFHLVYYGFFHPLGFSGMGKSVRTVNRYLEGGLIFKTHEKMETREIEDVFYSFTRLPADGTITAVGSVIAVVAIVITSYFVRYYSEIFGATVREESLFIQVVPYAATALIITLFFIGYFVYNITEYFIGPYREGIGEILFRRKKDYEKNRFMSIRIKSISTLALIMTSMTILAFYIKSAEQPVLRIVVFILVSVFAIGILILISNESINISLSKINSATQDLASGRIGLYFPRVSDRELVVFSRNYNKAAVEINQLRHELEQRVAERTEELEDAYDRLRKAYDQIHSDLVLAQVIQEKILPENPTAASGVRFAVSYHPMSEVGGDFYDITEIGEGRVRVFIADAMGHGVRAAMVTMIIKSEYEKVKFTAGPDELLSRLNDSFIDLYLPLNQFFTCVAVDIDVHAGRMAFASAGHSDQFYISGNKVEVLPHSGKIIGIVKGARYGRAERRFEKDEKLFLFSDGIFEQFNSENAAFGMARLKNIIEKEKKRPVGDIHAAILEGLKMFLGDDGKLARDDDILVICLERD
jgi:serine phosphatase RsbU (regulator of sigma subunit)